MTIQDIHMRPESPIPKVFTATITDRPKGPGGAARKGVSP